MKICSNCNQLKNINEFALCKNQCKKCKKAKDVISERKSKLNNPDKWYNRKRKKNLKRWYNITLSEYDILLQLQNGTCAICSGKQIPTLTNRGVLVVDHNHNNGKIRGLLCIRCNHGLGQFKDNPILLKNAITYLEKE